MRATSDAKTQESRRTQPTQDARSGCCVSPEPGVMQSKGRLAIGQHRCCASWLTAEQPVTSVLQHSEFCLPLPRSVIERLPRVAGAIVDVCFERQGGYSIRHRARPVSKNVSTWPRYITCASESSAVHSTCDMPYKAVFDAIAAIAANSSAGSSPAAARFCTACFVTSNASTKPESASSDLIASCESVKSETSARAAPCTSSLSERRQRERPDASPSVDASAGRSCGASPQRRMQKCNALHATLGSSSCNCTLSHVLAHSRQSKPRTSCRVHGLGPRAHSQREHTFNEDTLSARAHS